MVPCFAFGGGGYKARLVNVDRTALPCHMRERGQMDGRREGGRDEGKRVLPADVVERERAWLDRWDRDGERETDGRTDDG